MRTERSQPWGFDDNDDPRLTVRRAAALAQSEGDRQQTGADDPNFEDPRLTDWDDWGLAPKNQEVAATGRR